ncbi:hypothetical protein SAMN05216338_101274 [Bradyrhizobium sp. Rc2d]|nr:hypothetical protein SAMN05216338_101274 [Bradyrhizobium sp. Rc2d]
MVASVPSPMASATQFVRPSTTALPIAHRLRKGPSLSIEKPKSFGSWLINTVNAIPFM